MFDDSALLHAGKVYDPAKAHEYYLRTRELKGRRAGTKAVPTSGPRKQASHLRLVSKGRQAVVEQRLDERRAALQQRLDSLRTLLAKLIEQAKESKGNESKGSEPKGKGSGKSGLSSKTTQTPTQKREAAVRSKKFYEKNKQLKGPSTESRDRQSEIKAIREKIQKIRAELQAAIEKSRSPIQSKTAREGR